MAIFYDAPVTPDDLVAFVREVPTRKELNFLNAFPERHEDSNTVDWSEIIRTNRTARYRSFDGRIHVSQRDAGSDRRVNLLPLSTSLNMGEYERLRLEFARTGGTRADAYQRAIYNDSERLTYEVQNRLEQAWGDVLYDGVLTINEEGIQGEADFGVPANHKVTASTLWTDEDAPALSDLVSWSDTFEATTGSRPGATWLTRENLRAAQRNKEIVGAVHGSTSGKTRVNVAELNDLFASEGIAPVRDLRIARVDVDGTNTAVMPSDKVLLTPEDLGELGHTRFGLSATALELVNANEADLAFEEAPGIVGVVEKVGPPYRQFVFVDAVGMPILENARLIFQAKVR
ncbi:MULTISPECIES: major capsid protein [unclassified Microbacterium]|uniref:major capsid protein n=1 Tax=unclassified Microbacterium TaxID=2609290 RepID=UPI0038695ECC